MSPYVRKVSLVAMAALLGACRGITEPPRVFCPDILRMSLSVSVFDAATGTPAATDATVIVHSSAFQDSVVLTQEVAPPLAPYMVFEDRAKAGTYSVIVRKSGYRDWQQNGVVIRADRCGVTSPAIVTANLER